MPKGLSNLSEDELFERFRGEGNPRYLAEVFDRTAAELLRVALHVARDPTQAEDLVQTTFLTAIEGASTWDARRPVLPWLTGILTNLARNARRQDRRGLDAERLSRPQAPDPARQAEAVELTRAIDDAITELPEVYRPVLILHLRHGLGPVEIAGALGRPAGTLRSQLARGLDKLRGLLPVGFAVGLTGMFAPSRGLAAIRTAVLAKAAVTSTAAALPIMGALAMKKILATLAVLLAAITVWMVWPDGAGEPVSVSALDVEPPAAVRARAASVSEENPVDAVPRTQLGAEPDEADTGSVVVRVVWRNAAPAEGVGVRIQPLSAGDPLLRERERSTDAMGEARFAGLRAGTVSIRIDRAPGMEAEVDAGRTSQVVVELSGSRNVHGIVVDDKDRPIPGASIWVSERGSADRGSVVTKADAQGVFQLRGVDENFLLAAFADGFRPCAPRQLGENEVLRLHLEPDAAEIVGQVADEQGNPIAGALVRIGEEAPIFFTFAEARPGEPKMVSNPPPLTVRTDRYGAYRSRSAPHGDRVKVFARAADFVGRADEVPLRSGETTRHDIVLERGCEVFGVVTVSGSPGSVELRAEKPSFQEPTWLHPATRTDGDGHYRLTGVRRGAQEIVADGGERGAVTAVLTLRPDERQRWDPILGAGLHLEGRIVAPGGSAITGLRVELAAARETGHEKMTETDSDGRFSFEDCPDEPHELGVVDPASPMGVTMWRREGVRPGGGPLELVLDLDAIAAWVTGLALGPDGLPVAGAKLRLADFTAGAMTDCALDDETGSFNVGPLPAGEYELKLISSLHPPVELGRHELQAGQRLDLGSRQFEEGGQLRVHVLDPRGRMPEKLQMLLLGTDGEVIVSPMMLGGYYETPVRAGEYRLSVWGRGLAATSVPVTVRPGDVVQKNLELEPGHEVAIRLLGIPREELAGKGYLTAEVIWSTADGAQLAQGSFLFQNLDKLEFSQNFAPGHYRVRVVTDAGLEGEASFEVQSPTGRPVELWLHR